MQINFETVNKKILAMAEDFPESKYGYRPVKDVRSFAEVVLHIATSNNYVAKAANGAKVDFVELPRDKYKTKAEVVAALKQSIEDSTAVLKQFTDERLAKSPALWPGFIEHAGEHYGQLVVYYRINGLVPPSSRLKEKTD
ncbi:MAG: DinB family protein [Bryobacteraceae bacterium]